LIAIPIIFSPFKTELVLFAFTLIGYNRLNLKHLNKIVAFSYVEAKKGVKQSGSKQHYR
jgi:hypothetical protein